MFELRAEDETGVSSVTSTLHLTIQPVNDAPILSFVNNQTVRDGPLVLNGQTGEVLCA